MKKFLIIGLGSMGKRRVRNLQYLKAGEILGFDPNENKRKEAKEKYNIKTAGSFQEAIKENPDIFIISTPPDKHNEYIKLAIENKKSAFVEASVISKGLGELNELAKKSNVFVAPSCTLKFHPAIREIKNIIESGKYGKITNFSYHLGQYLPDWHPRESIKDFYVGKKETGGAREMVAFELTWLADIVGFPKDIVGFFGKTIEMGVNIDDTYVISLDFGGRYGSVTIDVVSRSYVRNLILNLEKGQILWRWEDNFFRIFNAETKEWRHYSYKKGIEEMYIDEVKTFINAVKGRGKFPNSLDSDIKVLKLLNKVEKNYGKANKN